MTAHAEEIKLQCNIESKYTEPSGKSEGASGTAIIDIKTTPFLFIHASSSVYPFNSVVLTNISEDDNETMSSFFDYSNSSKWEIYNDRYSKAIKISLEDSIIIDRNTGNVIFRRTFKKPKTEYFAKAEYTAEAFGTCWKVNAPKKKF